VTKFIQLVLRGRESSTPFHPYDLSQIQIVSRHILKINISIFMKDNMDRREYVAKHFHNIWSIFFFYKTWSKLYSGDDDSVQPYLLESQRELLFGTPTMTMWGSMTMSDKRAREH
jgi:hypothetical protein